MLIEGVKKDKNKIEDKSLKAVAKEYPNGILRYCGLDEEVIEVFMGEQLQLKEITTRPDIIFSCKNNVSVIMEFQSTRPTEKRLLEIARYTLNERIEHENITKVVILSTVAEKTEITNLQIAYECYLPIASISLKDIDGEKELLKIKEKIKNNEMLDEDDELQLTLLPFTNIKQSVESAIYTTAKLTNKAKISQNGRNFIKEIQALLTEKFVSKNHKKQIKKEIEMYNELFKEEFDEAREMGREIGKEENTIAIAKNMIENNRPIENIIEDTGLTRKQIENL